VADYQFVIADVFTDRCFSGNQLAVLTDARGLTSEQMQDIAREFNFAETTFVLPADTTRTTPLIRIFTPKIELPFAGHPTIGTAAVLSFLGQCPKADVTGAVVYEEGIGPICLRVQPARGRTVFSELEIAAALESTPSPDLGGLASTIGLPRGAIRSAWCGGIGVHFCFVHLQDQDSVDSAAIDRQLWNATLHSHPPQVFLFSGNFESGGTLYARMLAPALGIEEDAATGSACVGLVAFLAEGSPLRDTVVDLTIHQGIAMRRPSLLKAAAHRVGGRVQHVRLGGDSVIMAEGSLTIDPR
jgi:trans-2,3-dihydro-3-hydroxyanthranilate isomerase